MRVKCLPLVNLNFDVANLTHGFAQNPLNPDWIGCVQCLVFQHYQMKPFVNRKYPDHDDIVSELQLLRLLHDPILKWLDFVRPHCKKNKVKNLKKKRTKFRVNESNKKYIELVKKSEKK